MEETEAWRAPGLGAAAISSSISICPRLLEPAQTLPLQQQGPLLQICSEHLRGDKSLLIHWSPPPLTYLIFSFFTFPWEQ